MKTDPAPTALSQWIRVQRAFRGLTQTEAADQLGWNPATLMRYEAGSRSPVPKSARTGEAPAKAPARLEALAQWGGTTTARLIELGSLAPFAPDQVAGLLS